MIVNLVIMVFALLSLSLAVHSCVLSMPFVARWRERRRARRRLSAARDDAPLVELELENDTASKVRLVPSRDIDDSVLRSRSCHVNMACI